jgi:hypothetical protein
MNLAPHGPFLVLFKTIGMYIWMIKFLNVFLVEQ